MADRSEHISVSAERNRQTVYRDLSTNLWLCLLFSPLTGGVLPRASESYVEREKALGAQHTEVACSLNNLALLHYLRGEYGKAEPLYHRALAIWELALGQHPDLAFAISNLAVLYFDLGEYEKAEPLYQRALAIRQKVLEPQHPDIAVSLNNLAFLYREQGEYEKAEPLHRQALAIWRRLISPKLMTHLIFRNKTSARTGSRAGR
jgi:tetratricopeptide (TPR) repeat protein